MDESEYKKRLEIIEKNFENEKVKLYREFAMSNAKFKIGDTIRDKRFAFVIDKITVVKYFGLPEPVYHGFELKKDLTPRKDKSRVTVYGNNAEIVSKG